MFMVFNSSVFNGIRSLVTHDAISSAHAALRLRRHGHQGHFGGRDAHVVGGRQAGGAAEVLRRARVVHRGLDGALRLRDLPERRKREIRSKERVDAAVI